MVIDYEAKAVKKGKPRIVLKSLQSLKGLMWEGGKLRRPALSDLLKRVYGSSIGDLVWKDPPWQHETKK